jgi:ribosomal protein S18 acetylase RimI-like enzyme
MNIIRRACEEDIPGLLKLLLQVDMVHHEGRPDLFKGPATKYDAEQLKVILKDDKKPVFVCVDDEGSVLGHAFCAVQQHPDDNVLTDIKTLYIDDICVDEAARRQHVGKQLYDHVIAYAGENGFYNVTLNVWSLNPGALHFYESMGMKPQKIGMEKVLKQ